MKKAAWIVLSLIALFAALCLMTLLLRPIQAHDQGAMCAPADKMFAYLADKYDEQPIGGGILSGGTKVVIAAAPDGATFTFVFLNTQGLACLMATGKGFDLVAPPSSTEQEG
jgi:hypothetical protein